MNLEQPRPEDSPRHTVTITLRRDTVLLIAATTFLAIAITLALLFPPASRSRELSAAVPQSDSRTNLPDQTPLSALQQATNTPYPAPITPTDQAYPNPTNPALVPPAQPTVAQPSPTVAAPATAAPATTVPATTVLPTQAPTATPAPPRATAQLRPRAPTLTPTLAPTPLPYDLIRGTTYWTAAQSPIRVRRDLLIAPGGALIIEAGTEVQIAPGVSISVQGKFYALGLAGRTVKIVGLEPQRWEAIYGRPGGDIVFEHTEVRGGGSGGTVILAENGNLGLRNVDVIDNGGNIMAMNSRLEIRDSDIYGNDMPYGAAVDARYDFGGFAFISGTRIGINRMSPGAPALRLTSTSTIDILNIDVQRNLFLNSAEPNVILKTNADLLGSMRCNALVGGSNGLSIQSDSLLQVPGISTIFRDNAIAGHTPAIVPVYTQNQRGIGRGATSAVSVDLRNNWWDDPSGPYEPDRHADGRGEAVGDLALFDPWLTSWPSCAPRP